MLEKIARHITQWMIRKNVISETDYEVYEFGVFQLTMNVADALTILVLALCLRELSATICFAVSFVRLRKYAGGYHANTVLRCYLITTMATLLAILKIKYWVVPLTVMLALWAVAGIIIVSFAPVQSRNKPLDDVECVVYRKRTLLTWGIQCVIMLALELSGLEKCSDGILVGQCYVALAMCMEIISVRK